ncbi:MAG: hypothetical protein IJ087_11750 [Eggerthellaceae bacterium]|nr:hypothetical protein [Eggerthellaceae bacterium]
MGAKPRRGDAAREIPGDYGRSAVTLAGQYRKFFGASVAATLLLQATLVTDTIIVGQLLGPVPMSGVRVASPIVNILNVIAMLVGVGGATLASIAMGKRDRKSADNAFSLSLTLGIALGLLFALVVAPSAELVARLISSDESTVAYTTTFLRIVAAAAPAYILASVMAVLLRADGCIKLSSVVLAAAGVANVAFDLLFMGVLGMGVEGSAYATDAGMVSAVVLSLLYFRWSKRTLRLCNPLGPALGARVVAVFKNGASGALRMLFACIALLFLNFVVGSVVGVAGIAVLTVCGNIQLLVVAFFSAGGQAAMPMEGVLYGERDYSGLRLLMRYVFRVVGVCVAVLVIVVCLFPAQITVLFIPGGVEGIDVMLRLYALGFIPLAANYIMNYYYNTVQRRSIALALTLAENLVFYLPLIWVLTNAFGLVGAVGAFTGAEVLATVLMVVMASYARRKGGFDSLLLLPELPRELVYEATVPATGDDAAYVARHVKATLDENGAAGVSARAALGVEEMIANASILDANRGRAVSFDVRVSTLPDCVQVVLRDNGAPFDPTRYEPAERAEFAIDGIETLKAVASNVAYRYVIGMNQTIIEVKP